MSAIGTVAWNCIRFFIVVVAAIIIACTVVIIIGLSVWYNLHVLHILIQTPMMLAVLALTCALIAAWNQRRAHHSKDNDDSFHQ